MTSTSEDGSIQCRTLQHVLQETIRVPVVGGRYVREGEFALRACLASKFTNLTRYYLYQGCPNTVTCYHLLYYTASPFQLEA